MSKKEASHQQKMSRNDRFAQMSHQEKIIEQKKREILAKLEAKKESEISGQDDKSKSSSQEDKNNLNIFNNDGSFLSTFKHMKEKRMDSKLKSFKSKDYGEDRGSKLSKWGQKQHDSNKDRSKQRVSRFSDKNSSFEQQKITINTSFNNSINQQNFDYNSQPQEVSIAALGIDGPFQFKNDNGTHSEAQFPLSPQHAPPVQQNEVQVIVSQPLLISMPSSQLPTHNLIMSTSNSINLQPVTIENLSVISNQIPLVPQNNNSAVSCVPTVELGSIPAPNPIQVQNIPQPDPINTLNIPQPAPLQVQNIPTPTSLQLNKIPNPKPMDLMAIPTPGEKNMSDAEYLKSVPPPNKLVPPPNLGEPPMIIPPPPPPNCVSVVNLQQTQTIQPQNVGVQGIPSTQSILVHTIQSVQQPNTQIQQTLQNMTSTLPQNTFTPVISVTLPPGIVPSTALNVSNTIPALMAQPILPPPGMTLNSVQPVNISCPPPLLTLNASNVQLQNPPPGFVGQTPLGNQINQLPPMTIPPPPPPSMPVMNAVNSRNGPDVNEVFPPGTADYEAMASLARMVAQCGPGIQDVVQQRKKQDPSLWFLFHKESAVYRQYLQLVQQFKDEIAFTTSNRNEYKPEDMYEPEAAGEDDIEQNKDTQDSCSGSGQNRRKRKSRWGEKDYDFPAPLVLEPTPTGVTGLALSLNQQPGQVMLSKVTRTDPALLQYARQTFGSINLSEEEWKKAEDHYKINLLYQDMVRKREEVERLQMAGKNKYDYDSDEEVDGGTWEHKLREKEMMATQLWAAELTRQAEGKHHIGDFLPPEEFKRFLEKSNAAKEGRQLNFSDYKEFKIKEDNIGFKMLQKLGWTEGMGLGSEGKGIVDPINKAPSRDMNQGLGMNDGDFNDDDEYESYRKRMMLAYRFRPNPLNNPRRPYY
ncbi:hypothetical protein WA026_007309 [Henosepilachna vigintioctopunctata]|uniref:G-patch domain-containing protein n=1 Tax=Henosepilachna vigintioctopunctata TaxID=420089 RepID=A0AAW1UUK2_9CUCU